MSRSAISRGASIGIVVILVIAAAVGIYYYSTTTTPSTTEAMSSGQTTTTTAPPTTSTTPPTTSTSGPEPAFVKSNTLVYEGAANYQYLDPQVSYFSYDYGVIENQYEALMWWNGTNSAAPIPWLASNFTEVNPHTYVLGLRQGIKFQDGTTFNSTAVCFTMNRILIMDAYQPTGSPSGSGWIMQQLENHALFTALGGNGTAMKHSASWVNDVLAENFCQTLGTYKVQFNVMNPTAAFPTLIAGTWAMIVSPSFVISHDDPSAMSSGTVNWNAYYDRAAGNGTSYLDNSYQGSKAGTGAYEITSVNPTTYEIKLDMNPNYWGGPSGYMYGKITPTIAHVDLQVVTDQTTRIIDIKGGTAAGVGVNPDSIFSLLSRSTFDSSGKYVSATNGVTFYGPFTYYNTGWEQFNLNVTNTAGQLLKFQPFADVRMRLAVEDSANVSDVLQSVTYGLDLYATVMNPPGTAPAGADQASSKPAYSYNLTTAESLLKAACTTPLTNFVDVNGHPIASGTIDNSCSGQVVNLYYQAGDTITEKILTEAAGNLNTISGSDSLGITFTPVPVPAGTLYTLAGQHQIYAYWAGWIDDYNWAIDWNGPMFQAGQTYPSWSNYNFTYWNNLVAQGVKADQTGNLTGLAKVTQLLDGSSNQLGYYWLHEYQLDYSFLSTWVHGWFYNSVTSPNTGDYWAVLSFGPPSS